MFVNDRKKVSYSLSTFKKKMKVNTMIFYSQMFFVIFKKRYQLNFTQIDYELKGTFASSATHLLSPILHYLLNVKVSTISNIKHMNTIFSIIFSKLK